MTIVRGVIVLVGPGHVGKSTLLGFVAPRDEVVGAEWKKELEFIEEGLGTDYDSSQKYAYYVDTGVTERRRKTGHIGQTQHMHTITVPIGNTPCAVEWTIIDTPARNMASGSVLKECSTAISAYS